MIRRTIAVLLLASGCAPGAPENKAEATGTVNAAVGVTVTHSGEASPPLIANIAEPANTAIEAAAGANGVPADVQRFIERREGCEHWAGEPDWDDRERKRQIVKAIADLCPGIDTELATLRKRYAADAQVIAALSDFEPLGME